MQVANKVASRCVEMAAGVGFTKEYPLEKYYRDSKIGEYIFLFYLYQNLAHCFC